MSQLVDQLFSLKNSQKNALTIVDGDSYTFKQIFDYSLQLSHYFHQQGIGQQDRILLLIEPGFQAICVTLACLKLGISLVLIDPESTGQELFIQKIKTAQPTYIIMDYRLRLLADHPIARFLLKFSGKSIPFIPNLKTYSVILNKKLPFFSKGLPNFNQTILKVNFEKISVANNQDALIVFTSGTTSLPKAVVHTHNSLGKSLNIIGSLIHHPQPKLYTNQIYFLLFAMGLEAEVVFEAKAFNPKQFVQNSLKYKPNMTFAPPGELIEVIRYCKETGHKFPNCYEHILLGSAPVSRGFLKKLFACCSNNLKTTCLYGMTEVLPIAYIDGFEKLNRQIDGDLLGKPVEGLKLNLDDQDVLHVKAKHLCDRYLNKSKHEFVSTGDIVTKNKQNELILKGRQKDMILRKSFNIYPALYEPIIESIPGIYSACMLGLYDPKIEDERVFLVLETDKNITKKTIFKQLKSGKFSIDRQALPDEIIYMQIPRFGRQKKINKDLLRDKLMNL